MKTLLALLVFTFPLALKRALAPSCHTIYVYGCDRLKRVCASGAYATAAANAVNAFKAKFVCAKAEVAAYRTVCEPGCDITVP